MVPYILTGKIMDSRIKRTEKTITSPSSGTFSFPMALKNNNVAIRYFRSFLSKTDFSSSDYQLFKVGVMNEESGEIFTDVDFPLFIEGGVDEA